MTGLLLPPVATGPAASCHALDRTIERLSVLLHETLQTAAGDWAVG